MKLWNQSLKLWNWSWSFEIDVGSLIIIWIRKTLPFEALIWIFEALKLIRVVSLSKISVIQYLWQLSQIRIVIKLEHLCIYESVSSCEPFTGSLNSSPLSNFRPFSYLQIGKLWSNKRSLEGNSKTRGSNFPLIPHVQDWKAPANYTIYMWEYYQIIRTHKTLPSMDSKF